MSVSFRRLPLRPGLLLLALTTSLPVLAQQHPAVMHPVVMQAANPTVMAASPQLLQLQQQLAQQQAAIDALKARLDHSGPPAAGHASARRVNLVRQTRPRSALPPALGAGAAQARTMSARFSAARPATAPIAPQIAVPHGAMSIPPVRSAASLATSGLPPSAQQQIDQLTATVNGLRTELVADEAIIGTLGHDLSTQAVMLAGNQAQEQSDVGAIWSNLNGYESSTTNALGVINGNVDAVSQGAVAAFALACNEQTQWSSGWNTGSPLSATFSTYNGSQTCN